MVLALNDADMDQLQLYSSGISQLPSLAFPELEMSALVLFLRSNTFAVVLCRPFIDISLDGGTSGGYDLEVRVRPFNRKTDSTSAVAAMTAIAEIGKALDVIWFQHAMKQKLGKTSATSCLLADAVKLVWSCYCSGCVFKLVRSSTTR